MFLLDPYVGTYSAVFFLFVCLDRAGSDFLRRKSYSQSGVLHSDLGNFAVFLYGSGVDQRGWFVGISNYSMVIKR